MIENVSLSNPNRMYFKNTAPKASTAPRVNGITVDTFEGRAAVKGKTWFGNSFDEKSGFKKLKDKFSEEDIKILNEKKELPQGYYLKAVGRHWRFSKSAKVEDGKMPKKVKLVKLSDEQVKELKNKGKFVSNKMPDGFKLTNDKKGNTYLLSEKHENYESTRKWIKKQVALGAALIVGTVAAVIGGCKLIDKFYPPKL